MPCRTGDSFALFGHAQNVSFLNVFMKLLHSPFCTARGKAYSTWLDLSFPRCIKSLSITKNSELHNTWPQNTILHGSLPASCKQEWAFLPICEDAAECLILRMLTINVSAISWYRTSGHCYSLTKLAATVLRLDLQIEF